MSDVETVEFTTESVSEIWRSACAAAQAAAEKENGRLPPEGKRGLDVGYAWLTIRPARGPLVSMLKRSHGPSRSFSGGSGYSVWGDRLHTVVTQSISVHYAAADAAATVLRGAGFSAYPDQRYD